MKQFKAKNIAVTELPIYPTGARLIIENDKFWLASSEYGELIVFIIGDDLQGEVQIQDIFEGLHLFMDRRGSSPRVVCQLEDPMVAEKFIQVMQFIALEAVDVSEKDIFIFVLSRLKEWSSFLKPRRIGITEESLVGVVGELYIFKNYFLRNFLASQAVDYFVGPNAAPQDFAGEGFALEVKSSLKKVPSSLRISSLEQLELASQRLGICLIQMDFSENGFSVKSLQEEVEETLKADFLSLMKFREKINSVIGDASDTQFEKKFSLNRERFWRVRDQFPALVRGSVPKGIIRAEYSVDINSIDQFLDPEGIQGFLNE